MSTVNIGCPACQPRRVAPFCDPSVAGGCRGAGTAANGGKAIQERQERAVLAEGPARPAGQAPRPSNHSRPGLAP